MMIMAAPNGARKTKADHPGLPITVSETVATAQSCYAAGATALHLHVRDAKGRHSIDAGLYRAALAAVTEAVPDMAVQVTTESAGLFGPKAQFATLQDLRPAWTTLALREIVKDKALARDVYAFCDDEGIALQHIIYDAEDAGILRDWQALGLLGAHESVILVLGRYAADMNSDPADFDPLLAALPPVGRWMLCAFGPNEHACLHAAASRGGDLRVGFENATQREDGTLWPDMQSSVRALRTRLGDLK